MMTGSPWTMIMGPPSASGSPTTCMRRSGRPWPRSTIRCPGTIKMCPSLCGGSRRPAAVASFPPCPFTRSFWGTRSRRRARWSGLPSRSPIWRLPPMARFSTARTRSLSAYGSGFWPFTRRTCAKRSLRQTWSKWPTRARSTMNAWPNGRTRLPPGWPWTSSLKRRSASCTC